MHTPEQPQETPQDKQEQQQLGQPGQGSPNPQLSLLFVGRFIQQFRRNVNNATVALIQSNMIDDDAAAAMLCVLDSNAAAAYVALQQQLEMQTDAERTREHYELIRSGTEGLAVEAQHLANPIPKRSNPFVFSFPFLIPPFRDSSLAETMETLSSISAVGLYNCALARHTLSFRVQGQEKEELLGQAKVLYQQALEMLDSLKTLSPEGTLVQIYLACCNNMAEVLAAQDRNEESKEFQEFLRRSLWAVPPARSSVIYNHFVTAVQTYDIEVLPVADDPLLMDC